MADYIEREAAIKTFGITNQNRYDRIFLNEVEDALEALPAAEVKPVVHGRWLKSDIEGSILCKCSVCDFDLGAYSHNFCPNCGADMRSTHEE